MDKNVIFRRCIVSVTAFLFTLLLLATLLLGVAETVISKPYFMKIAELSNYDDLAFESLKEELSNLTIPSGLPEDFFEDKLDKNLFFSRVEKGFAANAKGAALPYSDDEIKEEFYNLAYDFALTQNRVVSDEAKVSLSGFADECAAVYLRYSNPSSVKTVLSFMTPLAKPILVALSASFAVTAAALFLLIRLCRGRDLLKHLFFSFGGASLLLGVFPLLLLITGEIKRISLTSKSLHALAVSFIEGGLVLMLICAALMLILTIIFLIFDLKKSRQPQ